MTTALTAPPLIGRVARRATRLQAQHTSLEPLLTERHLVGSQTIREPTLLQEGRQPVHERPTRHLSQRLAYRLALTVDSNKSPGMGGLLEPAPSNVEGDVRPAPHRRRQSLGVTQLVQP